MSTAQDKIKVGQFLGRRQADPDDSEDQLAPGGNMPEENSFLEQYKPELNLSQPSPVSTEATQKEDLTDNRFSPSDQYTPYAGFPINTPGDSLLNPIVISRYAENVAKRLGSSGLTVGSLMIATQAGLQAMNREGRILNPTAFPVAIPGLELVNPISVDSAFAQRKIAGQINDVDDVHLQLSKGDYNRTYASDDIVYPHSVTAGGTQIGQNNPVVGAKSQNDSLTDNAYVNPLNPLVEEGIKARNRYSDYTPNISPDRPKRYEERPAVRLADLNKDSLANGDEFVKNKVKSLFYNPHVQLATPKEYRPRELTISSKMSEDKLYESNRNYKGAKSLSVKLDGENKYGFTTDKNKVEPGSHVPLFFTDLRPLAGGNKLRTVFFRPFLTNIGESFSPQWNLINYFGRTDQVATYMSTGRVINIGFQLIAFSPQDTRDIYQKLHWLTSMVYPQVDSSLIMRSGPATRLRIGNVIDAVGPDGQRGLPGVIQSLDYDYSDSIWELEDNYKAPRKVNISLSFLVLHDKPMGVGDLGKFGGIGSFNQNGYVPPETEVNGNNQAKLARIDKGDSFRAIGNGFQDYETIEEAERI